MSKKQKRRAEERERNIEIFPIAIRATHCLAQGLEAFNWNVHFLLAITAFRWIAAWVSFSVALIDFASWILQSTSQDESLIIAKTIANVIKVTLQTENRACFAFEHTKNSIEEGAPLRIMKATTEIEQKFRQRGSLS